MAEAPTESPGITCEVDGKAFSFTFKTYGIQLNQFDRKKSQGYVIKWFYVIGSTRDAEKAPNVVNLHHARKKAFGGSGFQEKGPVPDETSDATRLTVLKYPKLAFEQLTISFPDAKSAKKTHRGIWKRLKILGQVPGTKWRVFLNPFSGSKKSKKTWLSFEPYLHLAGVDTEVSETQYAGHCSEMVEYMDLDGVDMLVSVSGDGMLHELVNGLMRRKDWHRATQIPVGVIPCGTGNALASSLMFPNALSALLAAIKRQWQPLDLMAMYQYTYPIPSTDTAIEPSLSPSSSSKSLSTSTSKSKSSPAPSAKDPKSRSPSVSPLPATSQTPPPFEPNGTQSPFSPREAPEDSSQKKRKAKKSEQDSAATASTSPSASPAPRASPSPANLDARSRAATTSSASPSSRKPISEAARALAAKRAVQEPGTWNLVCYAFQAFMWGFVSDVDIETEPWRWMGEFRLTLGSIRRIAALRHYPARLLTLELEGSDAHMTTCQFHEKCTICKAGQDIHHERHAKLERLFSTTAEGSIVETVKVAPQEPASPPSPDRIIIPEEDLVQEDIRASMELESAPKRPKNGELKHKKKKNNSKSSEDEPQEMEREKSAKKEEESSQSPAESTVVVTDDTTVKSSSSSILSSKKSKKSTTPALSPEGSAVDLSTSKAEASPPEPESTTVTPVTQRKNKKKSSKKIKVLTEAEEEEEPKEVANQEIPVMSAPTQVVRGLARGLDSLITFDPMAPGFEMSNGWQERQDKFVYFVASNVSHLAGDLKVAPFAHTSGGSVDVVFATSIAKMEFLDLMAGSMENGRYVSNSNVTYEKARAFVLIPTGKPGIMDLDGEEYDSLPTAIEVHPGVIRACVAVWNMSLHPDDV